jgi:hypothetical protein
LLEEKVSTNGFDDKKSITYVPIDLDEKEFSLDLAMGPKLVFKGYYEDSDQLSNEV